MTQTILKQLSAPFHDSEIEWRTQTIIQTQRGVRALILPYVTARGIMNRLDEVLGMDWYVEYEPWMTNGVKCSIFVRVNGNWISRQDGAEQTEVESIKGGFSSALKRAAVLFGIGRYLYYLEQTWVELHEQKQSPQDQYVKHKGQSYYFTPPTLYVAPPAEQQGPAQQTQQKQSSKPQGKQATDKGTGKEDLEKAKLLEAVYSMAKGIGMEQKDVIDTYNALFHTKLRTLNNAHVPKLTVMRERLEKVHQAIAVQGSTPNERLHQWLSIRLNNTPITRFGDWLLHEQMNILVDELISIRQRAAYA